MSQIGRNQHAAGANPVLTLGLGTAVVTGTLFLAVTVVAPIIRQWFGVPLDFDQDYTSREAFRQALAVQTVCLAAAFMLFGAAAGVRGEARALRWSFLAANPLTVGVGFWLYRTLMDLNGPAEYFGYVAWTVLSLLSPLIFAPCALVGVRLASRRKGRNMDADRDI